MNQQIKFRGYHKATKQWVYGDLIQPQRGNVHAVILVTCACNGGWLMPLQRYAVDPESVGQYTGYTDKAGKEIYRGDLVRSHNSLAGMGSEPYKPLGEIVWGGRLAWEFWDTPADYYEQLGEMDDSALEVIGTIYENPELVK